MTVAAEGTTSWLWSRPTVAGGRGCHHRARSKRRPRESNRNRAIVAVVDDGDVIVGGLLVSRLLAQVVTTPELTDVVSAQGRGVHLNLPKDIALALEPGDRLIVLSAS